MPLVGPVIRSLGAPVRDVWPGSVGAPAENGGVPATAQSFSSYLKDALDQINALQREADAASTALVTGDLSDIHRAVIASEKAGLALQLAIEVRNKVIEAYQEIMRMQI
ncbi:MAG: flagellar hook-basal body complex protein FliE [Firmicutes bacterium]|jgi:flagellar hook-basal body complex protein FliE|nr:flagellar hook-basal body complex protein FliE [Bacillota bacterium]